MAQQEVESAATESSLESPDPSLSRKFSFSKLNAKAPEFVPTRPQQPPTRLTVVPTPPPPPPVLHIYPPPPPPAPFHVPIHSPVPLPHVIPLQNHHHHNNHHHQPPQQQYVPVRNHNNRDHHGNNNHYAQARYHGNNHHHYHSQSRKAPPDEQGEAAGNKDTALISSDHSPDHDNSGLGLSDEAAHKLLNQVEYYFSDINLATTDHLMRFISKDPDGYVPISVVSSFKKVKAAINSNSQLATILRNSSKLVVSEDGRKVRRQQPLTESDIEELQSRVVVAENLPDDHCHQHLMKIFSSVGNVRTIRTCPPQTSGNGAASATRPGKADGGMHFSNKLHSFVEYESVEMAEKAVVELNDEGNWRSGLRVRLMLKRVPKPTPTPAGGKKGNDGLGQSEEEDVSSSEHVPDEKQFEDAPEQCDARSYDHSGEDHVNVNDKEDAQRKARNKGRGKGRGRGQYHHNRGNNRGNHVGTPPSNNVVIGEHPIVSKQPPGPRMPDGTKGFAMGRGKPVTVNNG